MAAQRFETLFERNHGKLNNQSMKRNALLATKLQQMQKKPQKNRNTKITTLAQNNGK